MEALLSRWDSVGDRRRLFLQCYMVMTTRMAGAIDQGEFGDGVWVDHLLTRFADAYFGAVEAYEAGDGHLATPWRITFDTARDRDLTVVQHLFLGINAHINYDLVVVLAELLDPEWRYLDTRGRRMRQQDHMHVNRIIARTVDEVQDTVVERHAPSLAVVDAALGPVDEWLASRLLAGWRNQVWRHAVALVESAGGDERRERLKAVEEAAARRAERILVLGPP